MLKIDDSSYKVLVANAEKALAEAHLALLQEERKHQRAGKEWQSSGISEKPSPLALRQPQLNIAKTSYLAAKQTLNDAKKNLLDTKIYAPFDGIVSEQSVTMGGYIASGSKLGKIKSIDVAEVLLALPENDWRQLPRDLSELIITISSKNSPEETWYAKATSLSLLVDKKTRMRNLTLEIPDPLKQKQALLFGSFVEVDIQGKAYPDSYIIASSSLTADGFLWIVRNEVLERHKPNVLFHSVDHIGIGRKELGESISLVVKPLSHYIAGMDVVTVESTREVSDEH